MSEDMLSLEVMQNAARIRRMAPRARLEVLKGAVEEGASFIGAYENIRQMVDPMDVMTDVQVFGAEISTKMWKDESSE